MNSESFSLAAKLRIHSKITLKCLSGSIYKSLRFQQVESALRKRRKTVTSTSLFRSRLRSQAGLQALALAASL